MNFNYTSGHGKGDTFPRPKGGPNPRFPTDKIQNLACFCSDSILDNLEVNRISKNFIYLFIF